MKNLLVTRPATDARILIIDDEASSIQPLMRLLELQGYGLCLGMTDPRKAIADFRTIRPDIVLLDWHMSPLNGKAVMEALRTQVSPESMPPVVVLTGDICAATRREALAAGATDFLSKPVDPSEVLLRIRNLLRLRRLMQHVAWENQRLEEKVRERTAELQRTVVELKEAQQQAIQQERMHALADMAGGVAHDFNNILMVIRGYSELYSLRLETECPREELQKCFEVIALASHDGGEIVRRLQEFYRPAKSVEDREPLDLADLIGEAVELARPKWQTQARAKGLCVTVVTTLQPLAKVVAAPHELREVLTNLIFNAVDAMPQGGQISLRTWVELDRVFLEVEDSGTGMTQETRARCLEPFYTTKGEQGTGLGLAIIHGIVRRHNGTMRIHSELNVGTRVTITLPQNVESVEGLGAEAAAIPHHLRVLVVDDDPQICAVISRFLQLDAHTVTVAANACEALEKFATGQFDLVITDQVMPKMNGEQLATAIKEIQPDEPVILLTGFEALLPRTSIDAVVSKPATMDALRNAISQVLPRWDKSPASRHAA